MWAHLRCNMITHLTLIWNQQIAALFEMRATAIATKPHQQLLIPPHGAHWQRLLRQHCSTALHWQPLSYYAPGLVCYAATGHPAAAAAACEVGGNC
jgi:hypothetical protein